MCKTLKSSINHCKYFLVFNFCQNLTRRCSFTSSVAPVTSGISVPYEMCLRTDCMSVLCTRTQPCTHSAVRSPPRLRHPRQHCVSQVSQFCILIIICNHNSNLANRAKSCFTSWTTLLNRLHQTSTV